MRSTGDYGLNARLGAVPLQPVITTASESEAEGGEEEKSPGAEPPPVAPTTVSPHIIAMRIMRRDNYLIAMLNKDVIDLRVQVPVLGTVTLPFTKCFEWNFHV